ncbi:MAG TPA: ATP-binding protein, partial [Caldimonas sp.]|nr:ATP-binding protein [Caldimonas sp.]
EYAIFMLDVNGRVATWNVGAERIKGYKANEIIGRHFSVFYPPEVRQSGWPEHELQVAADVGSFTDEGWRLRKDGTPFWAHVTITALRDEKKQLLGFAKLTRDQSERKRSEAAEVLRDEREEILEAERSARMAAQRAVRIKDEFLATLSHELRTPLSAILGWTQVLLRSAEIGSGEKTRHAIEVIDRNARAQVQLIDDLLDLSRLMTGKIRLDLRQVAVADLVQSAVDSVWPAAEAKGIALEAELDAGPATLSADSGRLQQVMSNLLGNAVKFTPRGGRVRVALQTLGSRVELSVSDTGIGIPADFLPRVFDRFSQRDSSTTRAFGGLGLGLAISRQLVELHGGTITVASPGEGQGATFVVELPLSTPQTEDDNADHPQPTGQTASGEVLALPRLEGIHAFIVDDEQDAREVLRRVLEDQGARVTAFSSAEDVLATLETSRPSILISDVGMPGMDGYQLIRALRAAHPGDRLPALALTAFARAEDRKRSLVAGYQAHLAKPFDVGELILVVAGMLGK